MLAESSREGQRGTERDRGVASPPRLYLINLAFIGAGFTSLNVWLPHCFQEGENTTIKPSSLIQKRSSISFSLSFSRSIFLLSCTTISAYPSCPAFSFQEVFLSSSHLPCKGSLQNSSKWTSTILALSRSLSVWLEMEVEMNFGWKAVRKAALENTDEANLLEQTAARSVGCASQALLGGPILLFLSWKVE